jgi:hypothetical protein
MVGVAGSSVAGTKVCVAEGDAVLVGAAGSSVAGIEVCVGNGDAVIVEVAGSPVAGDTPQERTNTIAPKANRQKRHSRERCGVFG